MLTARIDYKKIKETKNISYLDSWYCPLEKAGHAGSEPMLAVKIASVSTSQYMPTLILNRIPININKRHAVAGF